MKVIDDDKRELCRMMWVQHSDELKKICEYKLSSCRDEIDDVIADAFYYLCLNICEDRIHTNVSSWLFAVTNNLIKKKYAEIGKKKHSHISFDEMSVEQYDSYISCDSLLFDGTVSDSIIAMFNLVLLDNLNPAERQLYKYVYKDKLRLKEIAEKMNLTYGAVKERNHRLSKKIKIMTKDYIESM